MPPLIDELSKGSTICLRLPKGKTLPKKFEALRHNNAVISWNGTLLKLTGQLIIQFIDTAPVEATPIDTPEPMVQSLKDHRDYYQRMLYDTLKTQSVVAIHGPPGCGKSSMLTESENHYSICADATMSSADILGNPSVSAWIRKGGTLVIDEYTLLEPGVLTWLNTLTQDGVALHTNEGFQSISSHTHKVVLLGNPPESTLGRQSQHTVSMAVMTMLSPPKQLWLQFATESGMSGDQKAQLDKAASDDWTSRDWQTAIELIRQAKGDQVSLWLDRKRGIDIPQLQTSVSDFLTYVDQIRANHYAIRALHVIGPAGVGKNHAIEKACHGKPCKTMTLGLHTDIGEFKRFIDQCFKEGAICVIDEMTAAPTAVLEVLNDKLAEPCANGFCVIATDNPYKEGREPMSDALRSRCFEWHASDITKQQARQILGIQPKHNTKQPTEFKTVLDFHFYLKDTCHIPVSMRTLHLYKNHLKEQHIPLPQKLALMYGHFDPNIERLYKAFCQPKPPTRHGYFLRNKNRTPAKQTPPRCQETFGQGDRVQASAPIASPEHAKYVEISNQQVRTFVTTDGRLLGLDGHPVPPRHCLLNDQPTPSWQAPLHHRLNTPNKNVPALVIKVSQKRLKNNEPNPLNHRLTCHHSALPFMI